MSCEIVANFCYIAGDNVLLRFAVTDEDGNPVTLTGITIHFAMAPRPFTTPVIDSAGSPPTAVVTVTNNSGGLFEVEIEAADTAALRGVYTFEAELEDTEGDVNTVGRGRITFSRGIA